MSILKYTKRTVLLLEPETHAALCARAKRAGLSIGEIIRRSILARLTETGVNRQQWNAEDFGAEIAEQIESQNQDREDRMKV
jgi:hypothetical protein